MKKNDIIPWPHQSEAFTQMSKVYDFKFSDVSKSGIVVLPTGAGKTFTSINWIVRNVLDKGMKVLWLAQSFHLIDQAFCEFNNQLTNNSMDSDIFSVRKISGNKDDYKIHDLEMSDKILVVTVQTAINNYNKDHKSYKVDGTKYDSNLEKWIRDCRKDGIFIVLDEAHHAPAYGCRNLLTGIMDEIKGKCYLLGLTATPTYGDRKNVGWLSKIFKDGCHNGHKGIIYQADFNTLLAKGILAKPLITQSNTNIDVELNDDQYNTIVEEHKGIPEDIISMLAQNKTRNDLIVNAYIKNKNAFKKTIIFADRWPQCVYISEKLYEKGIKSGYVFSKTDASLHTPEERNKYQKTDNKKTIEDFINGNIDVIVNVRMLTEGTDVPDTKTVFITRQTTSQILLTQMIGRALRGPKAGGGDDKKEANIVMFIDNWKQVINWSDFTLIAGDADENRPEQSKRFIQIVSLIQLKKAISDFNNTDIEHIEPFLKTTPIGWYVTRYSVGRFDKDNGLEQTEPVCDLVLVFEGQKEKYQKMISKMRNIDQQWGEEFQNLEWMESQATQLMNEHFMSETDNIGNKLISNVISIARHIGTNGAEPLYYDFNKQREDHDIDVLARKIIKENMTVSAKNEYLHNEYNSDGKLWKEFFNSKYPFFVDQVDKAIMRMSFLQPSPPTPSPSSPPPPINMEPDSETKIKVKERDNNTCQACGATGKGVRMQIDHIIPKFQGGKNNLENLQCLCSKCNSIKTKNAISFLAKKTPLVEPNDFKWLSSGRETDYFRPIRRTVNFLYCANVVQEIEKVRLDKREFQIRVKLNKNNDPSWIGKHTSSIMENLVAEFGNQFRYIKEIIFKKSV